MSDNALSGVMRMADGSCRLARAGDDVRRLSMLMPDRLLRAVDAEAAARGLTRSAAIEDALISWLHGAGYELTE